MTLTVLADDELESIGGSVTDKARAEDERRRPVILALEKAEEERRQKMEEERRSRSSNAELADPRPRTRRITKEDLQTAVSDVCEKMGQANLELSATKIGNTLLASRLGKGAKVGKLVQAAYVLAKKRSPYAKVEWKKLMQWRKDSFHEKSKGILKFVNGIMSSRVIYGSLLYHDTRPIKYTTKKKL